MRKLEAVEDARAIMTQGLEWGVFKWLMEKPKVRKIADRATEALNDLEDKVKATWSDDLKRAYNHLATQAASKGKKPQKTAASSILKFLRLPARCSTPTKKPKPCGLTPKTPLRKVSAS